MIPRNLSRAAGVVLGVGPEGLDEADQGGQGVAQLCARLSGQEVGSRSRSLAAGVGLRRAALTQGRRQPAVRPACAPAVWRRGHQSRSCSAPLRSRRPPRAAASPLNRLSLDRLQRFGPAAPRSSARTPSGVDLAGGRGPPRWRRGMRSRAERRRRRGRPRRPAAAGPAAPPLAGNGSNGLTEAAPVWAGSAGGDGTRDRTRAAVGRCPARSPEGGRVGRVDGRRRTDGPPGETGGRRGRRPRRPAESRTGRQTVLSGARARRPGAVCQLRG